MKAIESIEIAFRTALCYYMCESFGSHWYQDANLFRNQGQHRILLSMIDRDLGRSSELFINHYRNTYISPLRPPAWMIVELFTIGTVSKLFQNIKDTRIKKKISKHFSQSLPVMESWMHSLTSLRNFCAHHARLWNRHFSFTLSVPRKSVGTMIVVDRFRDYAWTINELLNSIHSDTSWLSDLQELLFDADFVDKRAMGFIYFDKNNNKVEQCWLEDDLWK